MGITTVASSVAAWNTLEDMYGSHTRARSVNTRIALATTKKGTSTMAEYFSKMKSFADELVAFSKMSSLPMFLPAWMRSSTIPWCHPLSPGSNPSPYLNCTHKCSAMKFGLTSNPTTTTLLHTRPMLLPGVVGLPG
jgi:hypothetical protein